MKITLDRQVGRSLNHVLCPKESLVGREPPSALPRLSSQGEDGGGGGGGQTTIQGAEVGSSVELGTHCARAKCATIKMASRRRDDE